MSPLKFLFVVASVLGLGALFSDWTVNKCSHCGAQLVRRYYGLSPFLRISPALVSALLGWLNLDVLAREDFGAFKLLVTFLLSVSALVFVVTTRRSYIPKNFRTCTQCGRKPGFGLRQFF
jgi:hypothetical protein